MQSRPSSSQTASNSIAGAQLHSCGKAGTTLGADATGAACSLNHSRPSVENVAGLMLFLEIIAQAWALAFTLEPAESLLAHWLGRPPQRPPIPGATRSQRCIGRSLALSCSPPDKFGGQSFPQILHLSNQSKELGLKASQNELQQQDRHRHLLEFPEIMGFHFQMLPFGEGPGRVRSL